MTQSAGISASSLRRHYPFYPVDISDFRGGIDWNADPSSTPLDSALDYTNISPGPSGDYIGNRWGFALWKTGLTSVRAIYFSNALSKMFVQDGTVLQQYNQNGTGAVAVHTFTTVGKVAFCDFKGAVVGVHPVDGVFTWDGATYTNRSTTVKGSTLAPWQNKVWVGGDSSNPSRVWFSGAGDATSWTTATDFVDIRDVDDTIITAIGGGSGMDIQGRPGLPVFKGQSAYRINSATTGAYTTIDSQLGVGNQSAVAVLDGVIYCVSEYGLFKTDGNSPLQRMGSRIAANAFFWQGPPTDSSQIGVSNHRLWVYAHGLQPQIIEVVPEWDSWYSHTTPSSGTPLAATKFGDTGYMSIGTSNIYQLPAYGNAAEAGGFSVRYQTPFMSFNNGDLMRIHRGLAIGHGSWTVAAYKDWDMTNPAFTPSPPTGMHVASSNTLILGAAEMRGMGFGRALSYLFTATVAAGAGTRSRSIFNGGPNQAPDLVLSRLRLDMVPYFRE